MGVWLRNLSTRDSVPNCGQGYSSTWSHSEVNLVLMNCAVAKVESKGASGGYWRW